MKYPLGSYLHTKSGMIYEVIALAVDASGGADDMKKVIYHGNYRSEEFGNNPFFVRNFDEFFGDVEIDGETKKRFEYIGS